jgi:hypothetical protein
MRSTIVIAVFLAACFNPPASAGDDKCSASIQPIPLCTVLSDAAKYDGKEITVRGLYRMVIHGSILMGSACPKDSVNLRGAPNAKDDKQASAVLRSFYKKKKNRFQPVDEVLRGTFRVAHQGQCFGQDCWPYEIEVTELLCAEVPKPDS